MIRILAPDIWQRDAVGNFCLDLAELLQKAGKACALYAQHYSNDETPIISNMDEFFTAVQSEDTVFLSYSIYDLYLERIIALPNRKVCYFHGVTPPELLEEFEPITAELCRKSITQFSLLKAFDVLIANSHYTASMLQTYVGDKIIEVAPPVFATRQLASVPEIVEKDPNLFLVVGRVVSHKKIEDALTIFAHALTQLPSAQMLIIGEAPNHVYNEFLARETERLGLNTQVTFVGKVDDDALRAYYQKASFLINASLHEGYGIPVLEAMHYGLYPIVRGGNAMEEVVGDAGHIFDDAATLDIDAIASYKTSSASNSDTIMDNHHFFIKIFSKVQ